MTHHQIVVDASLRLVGILIDICRVDILGVNILRVVDVHLVGRDTEALDATLDMRHLLWLRAVGVHLPQLHIATAVRCEPYIGTIGTPHGRGRGRRGVGQLSLLACCDVVAHDYGDSPILRHIVASEGVENGLAICREGVRAYAAHLPHNLGGEACGSNLLGGEGVVDLDGLGGSITTHEARK